MMRVAIVLVLLGPLLFELQAGPAAVTYHVQLVRGTDTAARPSPDSQPVGAPLARHFQSVFRWKNYWLLGSQQITVVSGTKQRIQFAGNRVVEIDLSHPARRTVAAIENGRVVNRASCPRGPEMTLIGRDRDTTNAWFVVVRRADPNKGQ